MNTHSIHFSRSAFWPKAIAVAALIFGLVTLFSAGSILFGPENARTLAGAYVPFVVWFNFAAGIFYVVAAAGIWLERGWALALSVLISLATGLTALAFARHVLFGGAFEMRTVAALVFRAGFWSAISFALYRSQRRA